MSTSPDVVREINFDDDSILHNNNNSNTHSAATGKDSDVTTAGGGGAKQQRKVRSKGERTGASSGAVGSMSEAEQLLQRLKEL